MRRLKFDKDVIRKVRIIVENHMRPHRLTREDAGPKGLRKFIREVGTEMVGAILDMAESDQLGSIPSANTIPDLRREIDALMAPVEKAEELPVDGKDVIRILGIKPGPKVGEALQVLKDKKFDISLRGREMTKDDAERILVEWFKEAGQ